MPRPTFSRLLIGCLAVTLAASFAFARPGTVTSKTGQVYEGDVTEKPDGSITVVTRSKIPVTFQADQVEKITYAEDMAAQYKQKVAALPPNATAQDHLQLARWLFENRAYDFARQQIDQAQVKDPNNADAALMRRMVDQAVTWEKRPPAAPAVDGRPPAPAPAPQPAPVGAPPRTPAAAAAERRLLTPEQINIIKQQELQKTDTQVRIRLENNVARRFTDSANIPPRDFQALPDFAKMMAIFERGNAEMRQDVKIINDPQSLLRFKMRIQPMILQGCATAGCHAAQNHAGDFFLYNPQGGGEAATYTNFYLLTQWRITDPSTKSVGKLIDRTYPERSLLLEFSLPTTIAESDHPEAQNFKPTFRSKQDPRYQETLDWIRNGLVTIEPVYGIDYPLPGQQAQQPQQAPPAPQPQNAPTPSNQQPQGNPPADPGGNSTQDALKNARERMRPIRGL